MSGLNRKQKRVEARREYDRFTKMWREDMRLAGIYGKKNPYRRPSFSQWYAQHEHEFGNPPKQSQVQLPMPEYVGEDPWASQLDELVTTKKAPPEGERGVATIQIVGGDDE